MGCREDGAPQTHDALEGGAPIRVHGETLVVLEHEEASGTGQGAGARSITSQHRWESRKTRDG
jgi:hypothetical protein